MLRPIPPAALGLLRRLAALAALLLAAPASAQEGARPVVVADSYPLAFLAERLAGEGAEIVLPVPEGRDPQFWRPSVEEIGRVQAADLILLSGAGFAEWPARASLPRARTVDASRPIEDRLIAAPAVTHSHGPEGEHVHEGVAAFTWLDLGQAALQAEAVAEALGRVLPQDAAGIAARLAALRAEMDALHADALALGPLAEGRDLVASHPRYQYFARAYGLSVGSVEWDPGATPDAGRLAELEALAEGLREPVFVWEAEPPEAAREAVAALGLPQAVMPTLARRPPEGDFLSAFGAGVAALRAALEAPTEGG